MSILRNRAEMKPYRTDSKVRPGPRHDSEGDSSGRVSDKQGSRGMIEYLLLNSEVHATKGPERLGTGSCVGYSE